MCIRDRFLNACSNSSYYDISIPAKQSNRGDYGLVDLKGNLVVDFEIDQRPSIMTSNWSYFKEDGKIRFVNNKSNLIKSINRIEKNISNLKKMISESDVNKIKRLLSKIQAKTK